MKINSNVQKAHLKTRELFGNYINGNGHNDCADAFRHAYFNMLNTRDIGSELTFQFGEAHECDSQYEIETEMDLFNNDVGINLALFNPQVPLEVLTQSLLTKLYNGELMILNNLGANNTVTSQSETINSLPCAS